MERNKRNKKYRIIQLMGWMIYGVWTVAVLSCAYRMTDEDWEKHGRVRLLLRRDNSSCPEDMMWYFYAEGSASPIVRTGDIKGYEGTLPSGCYRVAVCNRGCTGVTLEMEKGYEEACGRAQRLSPLKSSSVQIACPGNLYGAGLDLIEVGGREVVAKELSAVNLVRTLEMNIKVTGGEKGDVAAAVLSGRLTGVSSRVHIPSGKPLFDTPAFMTFEPEEVSPGVYTSTLSLFGLSAGEEEKESKGTVDLSLTMTLADGKEITSSTDITEEVKEAFTVGVTTHVILDLVVRYDEMSGLTITLKEWKPGSGGSGVVTP